MQVLTDNSTRFPHLLKSELLQNLPGDMAHKFLNACRVMTCTATKNFIDQGEPSKGIYLIAHGSAEVSRINSAGQKSFMSHAEIGSCLGEIEAISNKLCIASCRAAKNSVILLLPTAELMGFLTNIEFVRNITIIFFYRLEFNNSFRSIDKLDPVDIRLRSYLHYMSGITASIDKSQTDLALIICCSRQTMNKELGKLRDQGILALQSGKVIILDRIRLAEGIDQP